MGDQLPLHIAGGTIYGPVVGTNTGTINVRYTTYDWQYAVPQSIDTAILDSARQHLAALPIDCIPDLALALPPGSRMLLSPNPLFLGRDEELSMLAKLFRPASAAPRGQTVVISGLGGLGKTQLAVEFVHRYGQFFDGGVFWLAFGTADAVPAEIAACGGAGALDLRPDFPALALADQVRLVQSAWQSPLPRLLIFDNCEDESLYQRWRPPSGGCSVLITSRRTHWQPVLDVHLLPLPVLSRANSIGLLLKQRPDLAADDPTLANIALELGDLPLALHLAGSFLLKYRAVITPAAYLDRLHTASVLADHSLQSPGISPTNHQDSLARTFALSYERLDSTNAVDVLALRILPRIACFAPGEPVPHWLIQQTLHLDEDNIDAVLQYEDALLRLIDLGLLERISEHALRLHRLLAAFVRSITTDDDAQAAVEDSMIRVAFYYNQQKVPAPLLALQAHLTVVTRHAQDRFDEDAALLCGNLGFHLNLLGDYASARPYLERALAINEQRVGPNHADTARSLNNLANLLQAQGKHAEAQPLFERALAIREQLLGANHPDTALSLNNLANLLQIMGKDEEARTYYERALTIREQRLGADHPDTAQSLHNLGVLLHDRGNFAEAQQYYGRALAIRERMLGPNHPDTAYTLNALGMLLHAQGKTTEARRYVERALSIRQAVLGTNHPETARSINNVGELLHRQHDFARAQQYYLSALQIREKLLGPDHPDVGRSLNNLGGLQYDQHDYLGARAHWERALTICDGQLGTMHPTTQMIRENLRALDTLPNTTKEAAPRSALGSISKLWRGGKR